MRKSKTTFWIGMLDVIAVLQIIGGILLTIIMAIGSYLALTESYYLDDGLAALVAVLVLVVGVLVSLAGTAGLKVITGAAKDLLNIRADIEANQNQNQY